MKDIQYNILWIDDHHEKLAGLKGNAKLKGINLVAFKSVNAGIAELEHNYPFYDGVLLDAKILENEDDIDGTEDTQFIHAAKDQLLQFTKKKFEIFVYTGQVEAYDDKQFKKAFSNIYRKGSNSERDRLFDDLKTAASKLDDTQLKHQYRAILKVCDNKYIGDNQFDRLFSLVKDIENKELIEKTEDLLTPIRKIIEALFCRLGELGIIPSEILNAHGWINGSSRFLADKHKDYTHLSEFIHPLVVENIHRLLKITQDASHGEGELRYKVDEYLKTNNTDFLYKSTVFLLFDILMWFKDFIDSNGDIEANKMLWVKKTSEDPNHVYNEDDWLLGEVTRIGDDGWGTFRPVNTSDAITLTPQMVLNNELELGDYIKVITEPSPDGKKIHIKAISIDV